MSKWRIKTWDEIARTNHVTKTNDGDLYNDKEGNTFVSHMRHLIGCTVKFPKGESQIQHEGWTIERWMCEKLPKAEKRSKADLIVENAKLKRAIKNIRDILNTLEKSK